MIYFTILIVICLINILILVKVSSLLKRWYKSNTKGYNPIYCLYYWNDLKKSIGQLVEIHNVRSGFINYWFGHIFMLLAIDPDTAQFVLKNTSTIEKDSFASLHPSVLKAFGKNIAFSNGDNWRRHRTFVNFAFSTDSYRNYYPDFIEVTDKCLMKLSQLKGDFDCVIWYSKFTLDTLGKCIFHYDFNTLDDLYNENYEAYKTILTGGGLLSTLLVANFPFLEKFPLPANKNLKKAIETLTGLFKKMIEDKKNRDINGDMLERLLEAYEKEKCIDESEFLSDIFAFFVAGHETTSTALSWATVELAVHQDIQEKLYQEIHQIYGDDVPSFELISQSKPDYLEWFIQENMRMHPPVNLLPTRIANTDIHYNGQVIPKGTTVGLSIESIHKHPDHWTNPHDFDPTRFSNENKKGRHKFAYLPFSLGSRQCIGNHFSEIEQRLFLVRLLQKFKILIPNDKPVPDLNQSLPIGGKVLSLFITLKPRNTI